MHLAGISEPKPQAACLARNLGAMPNQAVTRHVCAPPGCATVSTPCLCRWPRRARTPPPRSASRRCGLRRPSAGPRARCTSAREVSSCRRLHHTGVLHRKGNACPNTSCHKTSELADRTHCVCSAPVPVGATPVSQRKGATSSTCCCTQYASRHCELLACQRTEQGHPTHVSEGNLRCRWSIKPCQLCMRAE